MKRLLFLLVFLPSAVWSAASQFNATTSQVSIGPNVSLDVTAFTAGCWTYRRGNGENGFGYVLHKANDPTYTQGWDLYYNNSSGNLTFSAYWSTGLTAWVTTAPSATVWHHVAAGYNGAATTNNPTFWVDGTLITPTDSGSPTGSWVNDEPLTIGGEGSGNFTWNGELADCFLYNRILSTAEVGQIMRRGPASLRQGLVQYTPLGVFSGRSYNTNGIDGTVTALTDSPIGPPVSCPQGGSCP